MGYSTTRYDKLIMGYVPTQMNPVNTQFDMSLSRTIKISRIVSFPSILHPKIL